MTDIDAAIEKNILDLPQRQRIPDVHYHREANNLGQRAEISEWISHPTRLKNGFVCLKLSCSDIAFLPIGLHPLLVTLPLCRYLSDQLFLFTHYSTSKDDKCLRVREIGKRKPIGKLFIPTRWFNRLGCLTIFPAPKFEVRELMSRCLRPSPCSSNT